MRRKKFFKKSIHIAIFMTLILLIPVMAGFIGETAIHKNETVYVILNHDGSVKDERVVNRVQGVDKNNEWVDYGRYLEISNMISEDRPRINGDKIIWPMKTLEEASFYYQGTTDKELPVEVSIKYYLDGKEMEGSRLAGKTGDLRIKIRIINKLKQVRDISYVDYEGLQKKKSEEYYVPLVVQVSLKVDMGIFSDIVAEGASKVVTGEEMNIGFGSYPYPEEEFIIEMKGMDIELEPVNIVVVPQELPFPDTEEMEEDLMEMADGLSEMEDGTYEILDGLDEMLGEADEFENGAVEMVDAISEINDGVGELDDNSGKISDGLKEITKGLDTLKDDGTSLVEGLAEINQGTGAIGEAIGQLAGGASDLSDGITAIYGGMTGFQAGHNDLVSLAESILATYPDIPENGQIRALAQGVIGEQAPIAGFVSGLENINSGASGLSSGLNGLSGNFSSYSSGIDRMASETSALPGGVEQMADGMGELYNGWKDYSKGISELSEGTQEFYNETANLPGDVSKLVDGIGELRDGIKELADEGISEMKDGVIEGIDSIKFSQALKAEVDRLSENYNSFMDNDKNLNSEVQFVMQTEKISTGKSLTTGEQEEPGESLTFFQRILNWFKK